MFIMLMFHLFVKLLMSGIVGVYSYQITPPAITPCHVEDIKCITEVINWAYVTVIPGIPELGIPPIDPLFHEVIHADLPYVKFNLTKTKVEGFNTCKIKEARLTSNISALLFDINCRRFHLDGNYVIDGNLLTIPIRGKGDYYADATKYHFKTNSAIKLIKKEGTRYFAIKRFDFESEMLGDLDVDMNNLFDGRKDLADPVLKFAKENGRMFTKLLDNPVIGTNLKQFFKNFNKFLSFIPADQLVAIKPV